VPLLLALATSVITIATRADAEPHKVQVTGRAQAQKIAVKGGRLLADYGTYQLYEVDQLTPDILDKSDTEVRDEYNVIELNAGHIDSTKAEAKALRKAAGAFKGKRSHLVQFVGPVQPEWYDALVKTGVKVITYIPQNAYLVYGDSKSLAQLQAWAGAAGYVQWEGDYASDYKIHPRARRFDAKGNVRQMDTDLFAIQLVADAGENPATLQLIDQLKLHPVRRQSTALGYVNLVVRLTPESAQAIAGQPDVVSIQPYYEPKRLCERQAQISAGNLTGNSPTGPGYLAWLAGKGFTQAQFDASGFAVDVTDSGVDNGTTSPNHFGLYTNGVRPGVSRIVYARLEGTATGANSTLQGCDGHGNLNAHIIGGYNDLSGFPHADASGFHYGLGICPFVRVGSSVIFDNSGNVNGDYTNPSFVDLQSRAYRDGARVSNNSWGDSSTLTFGVYNSDAQVYDALVRDAQPTGSAVPVAGNQEMVIVFAAGNDGSAAGTVSPPGTGKNIISVGAGENVQAFGGSDGSGIADTGANSANDIISFSSRGPCDDGRIKPDICAPGTHVSGGVAQTSNPGTLGTANTCFNGTGVSGGTGGSSFFPAGQEFFSSSSGTSHSTPGVVGGCALIRQYFINNFSGPPSPAMTKAYLINSARYMTGTGANDTLPSNNQGMGAMNLGTAFDGVARILRDQLGADLFTATGQTRTFTGTISDSSKPFRVTLAWTDAPGPTSGNAYKNNLDLTVTVGGNTYKGNVFSGANSVTGGSADLRNNVENVVLPAGVSGPFTVTVAATSINSDGVPNIGGTLDQDFALVVYNAEQTTTPLVTGDSATLTIEGCSAANGAIDPDETVTVNFALKNVGLADTTNLVATLLATGGVTSPSTPQAYGALSTNGTPVTKSFTFTANGTCGSNITATLQLQDGAAPLGTVVFNFTLGSLGAPVTANYSSGGLATAIPDVSTIEVPLTVTDEGAISDVNVRVRLNHTYDGDLIITLVHPDGSTVTLASGRGGSVDNYGSGANNCSGTFTVFDDAAATAISSGTAPFAGTFRPEQILSALNGKPSNGTWKLRIQDTAAQDIGTLGCWELQISRQPYTCCGGNQSPSITSAQITPSPNAFNDEQLTVIGIVASDPDLDSITFAYQWQFTTNGVDYVDQGGATSTALLAAPGNSGKLWRCRITPNDGHSNGAPFFTGTVAVNHRPNMLTRHGQSYSYDSDLFLAGSSTIFTRTAIINEFSQGPSGAKEWVEILLLKDSDLRDWTLRDSNSGTVTCKNTASLWSNLPAGTLIVVYNGGDKDTAALPADNTSPTNGTLVIAHNNATFFSNTGGWLGLANSGGDSLALRDSGGNLIDGVSYGTDLSFAPKLALLNANKSAHYIGNTEADADLVASWVITNGAAANVTPAAGNSADNTKFVSDLSSNAFNQVPLFRMTGGDAVPALSIDANSGLLNGTVNVPLGGFFNILLERYISSTIVTQQYALLVGNSNGVYTIPAGKTWAMNNSYTIPGTLIVQGVLDTGGRTLTVSNTLDISSGTVSNTTGLIRYHKLVGGLPPGASQQFNTPPVIAAASISPSSPIDTDDLAANVTSVSDADGDLPITFTYQWRASSDNSAFNDIAFTSISLTNTATTPSKYYRVVITPNDGIGNGAPFTTTSVHVQGGAELQILSIQLSGQNVLINYDAPVGGASYELQFKADLTLPNWDGIATNNPASPGPDQFIDVGAASKTQRFYRVRQF
jgi:subtilisin-like proprotein convertase family protein